MPYELKDGVCISMTPVVSLMVQVVDECLHGYGKHAVITSGSEGKHSPNSYHQYNRAVDFRIWNWPSGKEQEIIGCIREGLGKDFDVVIESDHLHVEYDPM